MSKGSKRAIIASGSSDCSTEDLILKDDDMSSPNGLLTTEPYLNYVVEVPQGNNRPCTFLNKFLILLAFLFFITTVVFIGLYLHEQNINKRDHRKFCTTADCVEAAAFMKSAMEENVNPCDDFYQYSCGGWLAKNPIPDGKSKVSVDSVLWDINLNTMRGILLNVSAHNRSYHSKAIHNCITLFSTCTNMDAVQKLGAKPLRDLLIKIGDFVTENTSIYEVNLKKKKEKLLDLIQKMHDDAHLFPYFAVDITIDDKNSSRYMLKFTQWNKGLGLELFRYKKNRTDAATQAYLNFLTELGVKLIGSNVPRKSIQSMVEETYLFEKQLSEIFVPPEKMTTVEQTYHMTSIQSLQKKSSSMNYLNLVQHMFKDTKIKIDKNEPILIDTLNFFNKLDSVIDKTDLRIIQNYIMFSVATAYTNFLTEDFAILSKNLTMAKTGDSKELPRWKTCVLRTDSGMGMALGSLFVEKTFAHSSYREANDLVEKVREAFIGILPKLDWMDPETVNAAQEKAEAIIQKIGYPTFIEDHKELDKFYEGLNLKPDEYFENQRRVLQFGIMTRLKRLRNKVDESIWYMSPPTINAYYNPSGNQIVFPAGILQPPFFKAGYPKSLNFGSMGAVIGHEITHGFDNNGRLYDAHGNYHGKGQSWWSTTSVNGFKERTLCFIDQYSSFTVAGQKIKGNVTLGENIADNGGLKAAFNAYSNWVKEHGQELLLPGLQRSNDEVFFIAFGQSWCTGELNKRLKNLIETDVHSPFKERVKGSVQNNEDFARVFNCPRGSPMNPKKKCSIW